MQPQENPGRVLLWLHGDCTQGSFWKNIYCLECRPNVTEQFDTVEFIIRTASLLSWLQRLAHLEGRLSHYVIILHHISWKYYHILLVNEKLNISTMLLFYLERNIVGPICRIHVTWPLLCYECVTVTLCLSWTFRFIMFYIETKVLHLPLKWVAVTTLWLLGDDIGLPVALKVPIHIKKLTP